MNRTVDLEYSKRHAKRVLKTMKRTKKLPFRERILLAVERNLAGPRILKRTREKFVASWDYYKLGFRDGEKAAGEQ